MKNLYYKIVVDLIYQMQSTPEKRGMWKFYTMIGMSISLAINIFIIRILIEQLFKINLPEVDIEFFNEEKINSFSSFFIMYMMFPFLLNYFLILYNKRYENLILKYNNSNGKLCKIYILTSLFSPFLLIILALIAGALGIINLK
jgi:hypothetical protein